RTLPALSTTPAAQASSAAPTSKAADLAAVKAVVREYYRLLNGPTTVNSARKLTLLMVHGCTCLRVARSIRDAARKGQRYFGSAEVKNLVANLDGVGAADVLVQYDYSRSGLETASGTTLHVVPAHHD